jgi:hypothetical protein
MLASLWRYLLPSFDLDTENMQARLRKRVTRGEFFAITLAIGIWYIGIDPAFDFEHHVAVAHGVYHHFFYAEWIVPLYQFLALFPFTVGYTILGLMGMAGVWFASRVFNGRTPLLLFSYQLLYCLFYGQVLGVILGGLGLMWWGITQRRLTLAGIGFMIALCKYQVGVPMGLALLLVSDLNWHQRFHVVLIPAIAALASLILNPLWPFLLVERMLTEPPDTLGSLAPWRWIGPSALLFWLPPILVPLKREHRLVAVAAASALGFPYFQQTDLLVLFMLPVGGLPLLGNLAYFSFVFGWLALQLLFVVPLLIYMWVFIRHFREKVQYRSTLAAQSEDMQPLV